MIRRISGYIESKTGVYLYPRFIISILALGIALTLYGITFFTVRHYRESVRTAGPDGGSTSIEYETRMRAGVLPPATKP